MNYKSTVLFLLAFFFISCSEQLINDRCEPGITKCVESYLLICKSDNNITFWDPTKCIDTCDKTGLTCNCPDNCVNGCNETGQCNKCPKECPDTCLDNGACPTNACPTDCKNGCDESGQCNRCPKECPDTCLDNGTCPTNACPTDCKNGCDASGQCNKCPKECPDTCQDNGACPTNTCPTDCKNGCDESGQCNRCPKECPDTCLDNGECPTNVCPTNAELVDNQCKCKTGYHLENDQCVLSKDDNKNHMYDHYETSNTEGINSKLGRPCRKYSDCDSSDGSGDGFCDSYIGYKCSVQCKSNEQCIGTSLKDGYNYVCRNDGRCAPDSFTTRWIIPDESDEKKTISFYVNRFDKISIDWGDDSNKNIYSCKDDGEEFCNADKLQETTVKGWNEVKKKDDCLSVGTRNYGEIKVIRLKHKYKKPGTYIVKVSGNGITNISLNIDDTDGTIYNFEGLLSFGPVSISSKLFASQKTTFSISEVDIPDSKRLTSMEFMFRDADSFDRDISHWDVSNVKSMEGTFMDTDIFNQSLEKWDVSNVTNMKKMFSGAKAFNGSLNGWGDKVKNVESMNAMFKNTESFNQSLDNWDVSKVTNMSSMFYAASAFNGSINGWGDKVKNVTNMESMFQNAPAFNQELNNWNVSGVTSMAKMFCGAEAFNSSVEGWNVSKVDSFFMMFNDAKDFEQTSISTWQNVKSTANGEYMLHGTKLCTDAADVTIQTIMNWGNGFKDICK